MSKSELENLPEDKKRLLRNVLLFSGLGFVLAGLALVAFPSNGEIFFGPGSQDISRYLGTALVLVGIADMFIAKVIFAEGTE